MPRSRARRTTPPPRGPGVHDDNAPRVSFFNFLSGGYGEVAPSLAKSFRRKQTRTLDRQEPDGRDQARTKKLLGH
jgi:hypothetical protein